MLHLCDALFREQTHPIDSAAIQVDRRKTRRVENGTHKPTGRRAVDIERTKHDEAAMRIAQDGARQQERQEQRHGVPYGLVARGS